MGCSFNKKGCGRLTWQHGVCAPLSQFFASGNFQRRVIVIFERSPRMTTEGEHERCGPQKPNTALAMMLR
jgi:hypothetical protein